MELLPDQQQANQEEQQAWIRAQQINAELWAAQCHDKFTTERVALNAQLTKLHRRKATHGTEWATTIYFTKA
jgi:hypothetical protein